MASSYSSLALGAAFHRRDVHAAKSFCEGLRADLERQRRETGRYPDEPFADAARVRLPRLLRRDRFYQSWGDHYRFSFDDPSGSVSGFDFYSETGTWIHWHG